MTTRLQRNNTKMIRTMKRNRLVVTSTWWKLLSQVGECHPDYATYYSYDINKQNFFNAMSDQNIFKNKNAKMFYKYINK